MKLRLSTDEWQMREPFVIAGQTTTAITTLTLELGEADVSGRGEALGVDYRGETAATMAAELESLRAPIEAGLQPGELADVLPPGGARNALDCALWDLRVKRAGQTIWQRLGLQPRPLTTVYTLSLDAPSRMAEAARRAGRYPILKLKLDAKDVLQRVSAVRAARPDAELVIDANGSWDAPQLAALAPALQDAGIAMIEQPVPPGTDDSLAGMDSPVPLCADESCQSSSDIEAIAELYQFINIKLDKCGGLSDALRMIEGCRARGLGCMVGNMLGSSLAMAPAFVVAQFCRYVDLDGPLLQRTDRQPPIRYVGATMHPPQPALWG